MRKLLLLFALALLTACSSEQLTGPLPTITWEEASARYRIYTDEILSLAPSIENTDAETTYQWTREGQQVGRGKSYIFQTDAAGDYYVQLRVTNRFGSVDDEVKITAVQRPEEAEVEVPDDGQFHWYFPWSEINLCQGRSIKVLPYALRHAEDVTYEWTLDGTPVPGLPGEPQVYVFHATEQGTHELVLSAKSQNLKISKSQNLKITVSPPEGTYRRTAPGEAMVNRVYEFQPAPGHQVNGFNVVGESFPATCTHEQACDTALVHFQREWMVSLGAQGGYLVAGFDHSVTSDLLIKGNPYSYQSEPGIVWVSLDANGDGLPNDLWFELAGSEYGSDNHQTDYAITYFRPQQPHSAISWLDDRGQTGLVPYLPSWNDSAYYWQSWQTVDQLTFCGSRLESHHRYAGGASIIPAYSWGYADNEGSDCKRQVCRLQLSNARTWDGKPANLPYADFVKVQTAQCGATPNLGEISTEIYFIKADE